MRTKIAIIGGGLSGVYAAYQLEQSGITDYILLEARDQLGGRIMDFTSLSQATTNNFDLGPTWFWPEFQPQLNAIIKTLNLETFAQYEQGNTLVERSHTQPPTAMPGYTHAPTSMRLKGGMGTLINALHAKLSNKQIVTGALVKTITHQHGNIEVSFSTSNTTDNKVNVEHVMLALPPRLAASQITFTPALPSDLVTQWQNTATWMAPHAKYIAVYDTPFWRKQTLSGSARSSVGPMAEIHDASNPQGQAALFGFIGIPADDRKRISNEDLIAHCRAQLVRLFGTQAATPKADIIKDWAQDPLTATHLDTHAANTHAPAPYITAQNGPWHQNLVGIGSEWSVQFPGYVAGAVDAANIGVELYLKNVKA
ncbi:MULTISPECIES: FAD-dependent oxidoreductase [unclassified Pseudoalteromonas]|uniref:flavin monoamine oxidase family protein n=1 Tax=unclassified Pseudoalteromonas TaxID=194690 RepID=UPI000ED02C90|nr:MULTISPECIES: FAD-dependent oxidoreductase [unclassified Pseudoalteromonas]HAG40411.1 amine oxidase [Pseudoalteromonas sp.]|tara:strand:- start:10946 stop:12049 length:1104 start_codon:yes stop_codon:yes gene_type:complete